MSPKYRFITFRFDRLNTLILQNDWSERSNFFELRGKIRAEAEFLKKIVTANKSEWLRNEILKLNLENLQPIRIWLDWEKIRETPSFGTKQHHIIKQLPKSEGLMVMVRHILLSESGSCDWVSTRLSLLISHLSFIKCFRIIAKNPGSFI